MLTDQRDPLEITEHALWHRQREKALRGSMPEQADFHGGKASDLEAQARAFHTKQYAPVCPYCFDIDDDDQHEFVGDGEGGTMMVLCQCGKTYLATAEKIPVWTTRKYP